MLKGLPSEIDFLYSLWLAGNGIGSTFRGWRKVNGLVVLIGIPIEDQTETSRGSDFEQNKGLGENGQ
jgi:hypothetical protein